MNPTCRMGLLPLLVLLAACAGGDGIVRSASIGPAVASVAPSVSAAPSLASIAPSASIERPAVLPTAQFANISEDPVSEESAAELQAVIDEAPGGAGMTATVMTADGTWSGAAGTADGVRGMRRDDQLSIGSITKSVIAAQVMQLVEAGDLALDDPATDHLPPDLEFDTNEATVRQLLGMRSGIPDYVDALWASLSTERERRWTPAEVLELVGTVRSPAGDAFQYSSTNYVLLGLVIEHVRGRPLSSVLRNGVLSGEALARLVSQPDEAPTEPMAMPGGESTAALKKGGGYLPSLAAVTAAGPAGAMASDSASLARWWSRFCGGEIVSGTSLTEMTTFPDGIGYGLGLADETQDRGTPAVGHSGFQVGYVAYATCLVEDGSVVVLLTNSDDDPIRVFDALVATARSG